MAAPFERRCRKDLKINFLRPEFVEQLPEQLDEGILYICEGFSITAHKCCCGCGEDVINKLSPAKWSLSKHRDGSVSLFPSIGNWKYECQSHYWISNNRVFEADPISARAQIAVQQRDLRDRDRYIAQLNAKDAKRGVSLRNLMEGIAALPARVLGWVRSFWQNFWR